MDTTLILILIVSFFFLFVLPKLRGTPQKHEMGPDVTVISSTARKWAARQFWIVLSHHNQSSIQSKRACHRVSSWLSTSQPYVFGSTDREENG